MNLIMFCENNNLKILNSAGNDDITVTQTNARRCGLQLTGFYDNFNAEHICVIGKEEYSYLMSLEKDAREKSVITLIEHNIPGLIISDNIRNVDFLINICKEKNCILLSSSSDAFSLIFKLSTYLSYTNYQWVGVHGVMMEVYGVGVLIRGISGIGKSETALEILKRGGRFVADDLVKVVKTTDGNLIGSCMKEGTYFMEIRGLGIIDVKVLFGVSCIRIRKDLDMIVDLVPMDDEDNYDRLGDRLEFEEIMGTNIPVYKIPVSVGRNIAVLIETAAIRTRALYMGFDFTNDFMSIFDK
ncbi:MAG: HPr(Ser) kinase/phosphatase [Eubacteriaceae bacterium]